MLSQNDTILSLEKLLTHERIRYNQ